MASAFLSGWGRWLLLALLVAGLDRYSKELAVAAMELHHSIPVWPVLSWVHLHNTGAAFSFLSTAGGWQRWALAGLALVFSAVLVYELRRVGRSQPLQSLAYALILGGALGNLHDRIRYGFVEDFILVHWQDWYFPAFNVADSAISIGAAIWILLLLREYRQERQARAAGAAEERR